MAEKPKVKRLRIEALIWTYTILFVIGPLLLISEHGRNTIVAALDRRPAIGYPVFRGEYTIFIMNMDLDEIYWFTDCPRLGDFTRFEEVAIYGDHLNHCDDWRPLTRSEHAISKN